MLLYLLEYFVYSQMEVIWDFFDQLHHVLNAFLADLWRIHRIRSYIWSQSNRLKLIESILNVKFYCFKVPGVFRFLVFNKELEIFFIFIYFFDPVFKLGGFEEVVDDQTVIFVS